MNQSTSTNRWSSLDLFNSTNASARIGIGQSPQTGVEFKVLLISLGSLGLLLNTMTMLVILGYGPVRRCSTYVYIFALSAVDFLSSLLLCLTTLMEYTRTPLDVSSAMDDFLCKLWYRKGILWSFINSSIYLVLAVSLERCVAVVHPIFYRTTFSKKKIYPAVIIAVFIALGPISILPQTFWIIHINDSGICVAFAEKISDLVNQLIGWYAIVTNYLLPLSALMVLYARIAWTLHKMSKVNEESSVVETTNSQIEFGDKPDQPTKDFSAVDKYEISSKKTSTIVVKTARNSSKNARDGVLKNSLWIALCYVCCYTVNQIFYLLTSLGTVALDSGNNFRFTLVILHCCLNPAIYCMKLKLFREGIIWLFRDQIKRKIIDSWLA